MQRISITRPDDWHVHFRDGDVLSHTVTATANHFGRALVMPNLMPPLTSLEQIVAYRQRIQNVLPPQTNFIPYMTFYLNEQVQADDLVLAGKDMYILGAKLYPAGATTHSEKGARSIEALYPLFEAMQDADLVLQIHGEVTHGDIFDREALFIEEHLKKLTKNFPKLRVVLEHISTKAAIAFVTEANDNLAATITAHHLFYNRNDLLAGGIKPHYYCLPILKSKQNQIALQHAAISGNPKFFAGTDSAPHARAQKESACGCAGIFSAPFAIQIYTEVFAALQKLNRLEGFLSHYGAEFYHQARNQEQIELIHKPSTIPQALPFGNNQVIPIAAGSRLNWSIDESV